MRDFINIARDADIGVVYYAGHGIEVDGTNYLSLNCSEPERCNWAASCVPSLRRSRIEP